MNKSFDWKQYILNYPDLVQGGIDTEEKAINHFNTYGINEGRTYNPLINFDWKQ